MDYLREYGTGNLGRNGTEWEAAFTIGKWHHLAMHIHWSEDPAKGNTRLWFDGALVLDIGKGITDYVLYRDGQKTSMSTRAGEFVTLRELREANSNQKDACIVILSLRELYRSYAHGGFQPLLPI